MKHKKIIIVSIICIGLLVSVFLLTSYAYWRVNKVQTGSNTIEGACLKIELEEPMGIGFELNNAWPITDEEGSQLTGYTFTVKNTCEEDLTYQVILDRLETENDMNSQYVKVELDDRAIRRYGSLEDADETIDEAIASKKIYTGIIPKKENETDGEVTHTIKLWISSDSPSDERGKEFNSKIRIIAGQQITPSSQLILQKVTEDKEIDATINNLAIGDLVRYKTEQFYVIGIEENNIRLLSRYLINVGDHQNPNVAEGLQSAELGATRLSLTSSSVIYGDYNTLDNQYNYYYGAVAFSNNAYWWDDDNNTWLSPYSSSNNFVYNNQASISTYINEYVQTLQTMGLNAINGTLLSIEEASNLCNTNITNWGFYSDCPNYLYETTYYLGSAYNNSVWLVETFGRFMNNRYCFYNDFIGVRPVINISLL